MPSTKSILAQIKRGVVNAKGNIGRIPEDIFKRLERYKIIDLDTGCWLWTGKIDKYGYGQIEYKGKSIGIHRLASHLYRGLALNSELLVCHRDDVCSNRHCFNPDHTFDGTYSDNNTKILCNRGHNSWYVNSRSGNRYCRICIFNTPSRLRRRKA